MVAIVVFVTAYISYIGYSYYSTPEVDRFYHENHSWFEPKGLFGHGIGVIGTFMIAFGVWIYIARKKYGFMERYLRLKYLLEFHIFLCTLGPILILFHTSFKFGGIVSIAFWSMVAVVFSGVVGRFIYNQIPRNIAGGELGLDQIQNRRRTMLEDLKGGVVFKESELSQLMNLELSGSDRWGLAKEFLKKSKANRASKREVMELLREERSLASKIANLEVMKKLFKYWHVIHKPFAIIMLFIVIIHVIVTVTMGYTWIF
ncbi:MAG: hypothetical protein HOM41_06095 [Flavobacteriales bacterium]|nr:hypothetical protein [Flavobacteriales bacterium]MBT6173987.1 hypothetical protein [Flavobacteriales bacterium]